jgi:hypothetical protein
MEQPGTIAGAGIHSRGTMLLFSGRMRMGMAIQKKSNYETPKT